MGHFSMEIYAPTGSNLSGNQQLAPLLQSPKSFIPLVTRNANTAKNVEWTLARVINVDKVHDKKSQE